MANQRRNAPQNEQQVFIDYRFNEVFKRLDRMEQKMDGFAFVKQHDFDEYRKEVSDSFGELRKDVADTYVTKSEFKPIRFVIYTVGGAMLGALATAFVAFLVKGGLR